MNAVAYLRVSTDEQAESRAGLEAQLHAITRHCERHGLTLAGTFSDEGVSGAAQLDKRPGLLDAVNAVTRGAVLLVSKRDRLASGLCGGGANGGEAWRPGGERGG
jgi:DNA invertase Pin-like site-specific DNA recombinase